MWLRRVSYGSIFLASLAVGFLAVSAGAGTGVAPAQPGDPAYWVSAVALESPTDGNESNDGRPLWEITYRTVWPNGVFPGYAQCEFRLLDADGKTVALEVSELVSYRSDSPGGYYMPSDETPASASVLCSRAEQPPSDSGYEVSRLRVAEAPGDVRLDFDIAWKTKDPPRLQSCLVHLLTKDGASETFQFELSAGEGDKGVALLPSKFAGAEALGISCAPFGE